MIKHCKAISYMLYTLVRQWCHYTYFEMNIQILKIVFEHSGTQILPNRIWVAMDTMDSFT